jgi:ion channel-forming bestrophin family protein
MSVTLNKNKNWFLSAVRVRGSVIPAIYYRVLFCGACGLIISILHHYQFPVDRKILASVVPSIVLGLLLVFRTNTAYDRFWEGRKGWGSIVNNSRNLARWIWVSADANEQREIDGKKEAMQLVTAFAIATKLHLRDDNQSINAELGKLVSPDQLQKLKQSNHLPLEISLWISDYINQQNIEKKLQIPAHELQKLVNSLVEALGVCERILRTPMPIAYGIHLRQLLLLYCLLLPFQIVAELNWWTAPIVMLVSFTLLGIEAIGVEIENPFGTDPNDLPLDLICHNIQNNIEDMMADSQITSLDPENKLGIAK